MDPAACARAKKELRLARERDAQPERLPDVEDPYVAYRRHTRPFRRAFRGIITRKEAERFVVGRLRKQREGESS
jgi:hypothetical protein